MALLSALVTSLAWVALALPLAGGKSVDLNPANFKPTIAKGLWFVESFSPHCHHCIAFAPTWEQLTKDAEKELPTVNFGQVNCVMYGDLCEANGIPGYPTMQMYDSGKLVDTFSGSRELDNLKKFISKYVKTAPPPPPPAAKKSINPSGEVLILEPNSFDRALSQGPTFVKFYAPWCGHCKKLAPIWKQLASVLQNQVQVAQIDCDAHGAFCQSYDVRGYPTLKFFSNGATSEYQGSRKLENLKAFAEKASADGVQALKAPEDLDVHIKQEPVVYLLIHNNGDYEALEQVRDAAAVLLGSPIVYSTSSSDLRTKYKVPQGIPWALIALKDGDAASTLYAGPTITRDKLQHWLVTHTLPAATQLHQDTFQTVMNAKHSPLVVIVASNTKLEDKVEARVRDLAKKWRARTGGSGEVNHREVIFTWMDTQRWKDWMKRMYGIQMDEEQADLDAVDVVVVDHQRLIYWNQDRQGHGLKVSSSNTLFTALEDIALGKVSYKNSENLIERFARFLSDKMTGLESYISNHPYRFILWVIVVISVVLFFIFRLLGDDAAKIERGEYTRVNKGSRLD